MREYYAGILFLTTNRIGDFDEAFASRIHMSLHYPELDEAKTKKIFKLNLNLIQERFDRQGRKITYDVSSIENFAEQHFRDNIYSRWNGRQIRNACQTALALAEFDTHGGNTEATVDKNVAVALQLKHFTVVQRAYLDVAKYLGDIHGTKGDRRAIDYHFRARTDTPYQNRPSRFSVRREDSRRSASDGKHPTSNSNYPSQSDPFQPLVNQSYSSAPGGQMMGSVYGQHQPGQYSEPINMTSSGVYEGQQGFPHSQGQHGQMDPRFYPIHQPQQSQGGLNYQSQGQGTPNIGMQFNPSMLPMHGQSLQGQTQNIYPNVQQYPSTQGHIPNTEGTLQASHAGGLQVPSGSGVSGTSAPTN